MVMAFGLAVTPAFALVVGKATQDDPAAFERMDTDRNGQVTRAEFDQARASRFSQADADRNGRLTGQELRALAPGGATRSTGSPSREQRDGLRAIDQNGDRAIDAAEFAALGGRMFGSADANRDGVITASEAQALAAAKR